MTAARKRATPRVARARSVTPIARRRPHGPTPSKPRSIAFFDFDNTIIHGDAGPLFGRALYGQRRSKRKRIGRLFLFLRNIPFISAMAMQALLYKLHARRRSSIVRSAYKGLRGLEAPEFYGAMGQFVDEKVAPRIYPDIAARIRRHVDEGTACVIITTGMEPLVDHCVRHLPAPVTVIGCHLIERKGKLTGRVEGPLFGVDKANILKAYCRALGIDPKACWAYSDHWSDKHMLDAVGHGVAVNPRGPLLRRARLKGWEILEPKAPEGLD